MKRLLVLALLVVLGISTLWNYRAGISKAMLHHDNRFLNYSLSQAVLRRLPDGASRLDKTTALLDYTHLVTRAQGQCRTWGDVWWLITGQAWCDHSSRVFNSLLEPLDIKAYTAYLKPPPPAKDSPHSVSYLSLERSASQKAEALQRTALVADTYFGVMWWQKDGRPAAPDDICAGLALPRPALEKDVLAQHRSWFCQTPQIGKWNFPLSGRSRTFRLFYGKVFPFLPMVLKKSYLRLALWLAKDGFSPEEYLFYRARAHHLFFETKQAKALYELLLKRYPQSKLKPVVEEFIKLLPALERLGSAGPG